MGEGSAVKSARWFVPMVVSELFVVGVYVTSRFTGADLAAGSGIWRTLLVVAAALVAVVTYQAWSKAPSTPSTCAMVVGLLGGAALASTVVSAEDRQIYASAPLAAVGTVGVVLAVVLTQIAHARTQVAAS